MVVMGGGGGGGGSNGPSHPSCRPRMYSFHVWRPIMRSPVTPGHSAMPFLRRRSATMSVPSEGSPSSDDSGGLLPLLSPSPFPQRSFRMRSASPALTSPSLLPSTTSQSRAAATRMGLTYSLKYSRAGRRPSPGGAERKTVILRGSWVAGRGSAARWETREHHFCWARRFCRRS